MADNVPDCIDIVPEMRSALRVSGTGFDSEIESLASAALADMLRVGVSRDYVAAFGPLVRQAVACYCKSRFGFDNEDAPRFESCYRQAVVDMLNSAENSAASA